MKKRVLEHKVTTPGEDLFDLFDVDAEGAFTSGGAAPGATVGATMRPAAARTPAPDLSVTELEDLLPHRPDLKDVSVVIERDEPAIVRFPPEDLLDGDFEALWTAASDAPAAGVSAAFQGGTPESPAEVSPLTPGQAIPEDGSMVSLTRSLANDLARLAAEFGAAAR